MLPGNVVKVGGTDYHLEEMDLDELTSLAYHISENMVRVKKQIETAAANYNINGVQSDPEWFINARMALKHMGRAHQAVQVAIGKANRRRRQEGRPLGDFFMTAAKELLHKDTFDMLLERARELKEDALL